MKFKKMNTTNSPPTYGRPSGRRGLGVGHYEKRIYFFELSDIEDRHYLAPDSHWTS